MSLTGTFSTMPFPDLLQWIRDARHSGTLVVSQSFEERFLRIEDGEIASMGSSDPRDQDLLRLVMGRMRLGEEVARRVVARRQANVQPLPTILCDEGVPQAMLQQVVRAQLKDLVLQVFLWDDGRFVFYGAHEHSSLEPDLPGLDIEPRVGVDEVLMDAMRRLDEWRRVTEALPSDYAVVHALGRATDLPALEALAETGQPLALGDLLMRLDRPRFEVLEELYQAWRRGLLAVEATPDEMERSGGPTATERLLEAARTLVAESQFDEAVALLHSVLSLDPVHAEARALVERAAAEQLAELYRELPPYRVPSIDRAGLEGLALSPRERYLAARVDGKWDIAALTVLTPLGELETLRILKRLSNRGLLDLS